MNLPAPQFQAIQEQDEFLALFPHRYDYIWAEHPAPGQAPGWQTESRHLLSDRLIQQGAYLYGVRFGKLTRYLMLDIDAQSLYHPDHNPLAIRRIMAALEPLDLVAWVAVSSSDSGGIHLYLPFEAEQESWAIAQAASILLEHAGFKLSPGQLELFPNPRAYSETRSLYLAHRLPLQANSYLLNDDFQPIYGTQTTFVQYWNRAQHRNTLTRALLKRVLKRVQRKRYRLSVRATKFLNDLNAEIEPGWTGPGQTNYLLGRITMREYIFGHVQRRCQPLMGDALVAAVCEVARSLPGFSEYCNHQNDLEQRAQFYVRSIQASHYYPYEGKNQNSPKPLLEALPEPALPSWNQQQAQGARDRIRQAVADLLSKNALPGQATARKNALKAYGIGGDTLEKYLELWHPKSLKLSLGAESQPILENCTTLETLKPSPGAESQPIHNNKLVTNSAAPQGQADGHLAVGGCGGFSTATNVAGMAQRSVKSEKLVARMQSWLAGDDPILKAEAEQYFVAISASEQSNVVANQEQAERLTDFSIEDVAMPGGFGKSQPKQQGGKTGLKEKRQSGEKTQPLSPEPQSDLVLQAEIGVAFAQDWQDPEQVAMAWALGIYNPLAKVDLLAVGARFLEPEEEDWLAVAQMVGWLDVDDTLDAIYFTAPPPDFALEQADWYVRPDLSSFLEEPILLRQAVERYPIPVQEIQVAIAQRFLQLGWTSQQQERFFLELFDDPQAEMTKDDWEFLLFELNSQFQDET